MKYHLRNNSESLLLLIKLPQHAVQSGHNGDPDLELRRGSGVLLPAQPAFLPSVISSFVTQNKGGGRGGGSPRSCV